MQGSMCQCTYKHKHLYNTVPLTNPSFAPFFCLFLTLFRNQLPLFYLLGDPLFGDHSENIHPLLSLVGDQLPTPCFLTLTGDNRFTLHV
jgi:hypothetical protein